MARRRPKCGQPALPNRAQAMSAGRSTRRPTRPQATRLARGKPKPRYGAWWWAEEAGRRPPTGHEATTSTMGCFFQADRRQARQPSRRAGTRRHITAIPLPATPASCAGPETYHAGGSGGIRKRGGARFFSQPKKHLLIFFLQLFFLVGFFFFVVVGGF